MKRIFFEKILVLSWIFMFSQVFGATDHSRYAPDRIIVKFREGTKLAAGKTDKNYLTFNIPVLDELNAMYSCCRAINLGPGKKNHPASRVFVLEFNNPGAIPEMVRQYNATGIFEYVEPDYKGYAAGVRTDSIMPNDTYFYRQWALYNDGTFSVTAKVDADIDMTEGWTVEEGDSVVIVGIIDSGAKLDHPELSGRIWINYDEINGNGVDDDYNGYIDDWRGWDFANNDNNPTDDDGHGTNVTGIIGANGNNSKGYAGVDWHCKLMILKALDNTGWGYYSWWISALHYATDNGAWVVNMSVCGTDTSYALKDAVNYALQYNVAVIACMGNNNNSTPNYPAAYPGVIAVGCTSDDDTRTHPFFWDPNSGSNYGSWISVVAPGNNIYGLNYQSDTDYSWYWCGTSQATPHVTGLAALLLAQDPARNPSMLKTLIQETAQDQVGDPSEDKPGWDKYYGWGRINAYNALTYHPQGIPGTLPSTYSVFPNPASSHVMISARENIPGVCHMTLSDITGKTILEQDLTVFPVNLDISKMNQGMYILIFRTGTNTEVLKLAVHGSDH